jgi:hypothetical protein
MKKAYAIRMFVRPSTSKPGKFLGVCTGPYLVVEGDSLDATCQKLRALLEATLNDAVKDGDLEKVLSQKAPVSRRVEYYALVVMIRFHQVRSAMAVTEAREFTPVHA